MGFTFRMETTPSVESFHLGAVDRLLLACMLIAITRVGGEAMTTISFNQVTLGSLARVGLICSACLWLPFGGLVGLASLFGASPFEINDAQVVGAPGLLAGIVLGVVFALLGTLAMITGACLSRLIPRMMLQGQKLQITEL
jgi:hypothetical protein